MWWHLYGFGLFLALFFQTIDIFIHFFVNLNYVYGLGMINGKLSFNKNLGHLGPLNGANIPSLTWANAERQQHCTLVAFNFQTPRWIFLFFWYWSCSYGPIWENHALYMLGKFWYGEILAIYKTKIWPYNFLRGCFKFFFLL